MMKGDLEGVLPMLGLLILAVGLAGISAPLAEGIAALASEAADDVEQVAETREKGDHLAYSYTPVQAGYSLNEASENLIGGEVEWNQSTVEENLPSNVTRNWEEASAERLQESFTDIYSNCELEGLGLDVDLFEDQGVEEYLEGGREFDYLVSMEPGMEFSCSDGNELTYYVFQEEVNHSLSSENSFIHLVNESVQLGRSINSELSGGRLEASGTASECRGDLTDVLNDAEDGAESELGEKISDSLEDAGEDLPERSYVDTSNEVGDFDHELSSYTEDYEESEECECRLFDCFNFHSTDRRGQILVEVDSETDYDIEASKDGWDTDDETVTGPESVELELEQEEDLLQVTVEGEGGPVPDAEVDGRTADGEGRVFFDPIDEPEEVEVSHHAFEDESFEIEGDGEETLGLQKKEGYSRSELTVEDQDGNAVKSAEIDAEAEKMTDAEGDASVFLEDETEIEISREGIEDKSLTLEPGEDRTVELERTEELLEVSVKDSGSLKNAEVELEHGPVEEPDGCDQTECAEHYEKLEVEATVESTEASFSWEMEDTEEKIISSEGYTPPEFQVEAFDYEWE